MFDVMEVLDEGTNYFIKPKSTGSISHNFLIHNGRVTRYDVLSKEKTNLPMTAAAEIHEVEDLIKVLKTVKRLMLKSK